MEYAGHSGEKYQPLLVETSGTSALSSLEPQDWRVVANDHVVLSCEDNLAFMKRLPDGLMKLVVTSPPYNLGKSYESKTSLNDYLKTQERVIEECVRILHPQGSICWQVGNYVDNGEIVPLDAVLYSCIPKSGAQASEPDSLALRTRFALY